MRAVSITQSGVGATPWKNLDTYANPFSVNVVATIQGTATYNIEATSTDYLSGLTPNIVILTSAATTGGTTSITSPYRAWRLNVTATTGSVTAEAVQAGL
jgi:hypothetical protein